MRAEARPTTLREDKPKAGSPSRRDALDSSRHTGPSGRPRGSRRRKRIADGNEAQKSIALSVPDPIVRPSSHSRGDCFPAPLKRANDRITPAKTNRVGRTSDNGTWARNRRKRRRHPTAGPNLRRAAQPKPQERRRRTRGKDQVHRPGRDGSSGITGSGTPRRRNTRRCMTPGSGGGIKRWRSHEVGSRARVANRFPRSHPHPRSERRRESGLPRIRPAARTPRSSARCRERA